MGIFNRLKKSKQVPIVPIEQPVSEVGSTVEPVQLEVEHKKEMLRPRKLGTLSERLQYIKENCEIIIDSERLITEAKVEYQAVTSYLQDMQIIDRIPEEGRESLEDAARNIFNLTKERNKLRQKTSSLSDRQYGHFERYELQIPRELPSMKKAEEYQKIIEQDMKKLDKEKIELVREEKDFRSKQSFLKGITIATGVMMMLLFLIFSLLGNYTEGDFTLPFLLTILMGMASALYIFMEGRKNIAEVNLVQLKQNRQIMLMNKVKIKAVNNRSYLEYTYSKYNVENFKQLKSMWEEYVRIKDESRRYQQNTELLEFYNQVLIDVLIECDLQDAEIWVYQPTAIIDQKEMVEIRHRLNVRRQNLRERIELNTEQIEDAKKAIQSTMIKYPDCVGDANRVIKQFAITL